VGKQHRDPFSKRSDWRATHSSIITGRYL